MTTPVTRRKAMLLSLGGLAALAGPAAAKSRITRGRVSAITDEVGKTQADAIAVLQRYKVSLVELRRVPGTEKEFASLQEQEIKRVGIELSLAKLKVATLHVASLQAGAVAAAVLCGAARLRVASADADSIGKVLPAIEQAKLQLLIPAAPEARAILDKFPSKALGVDWDPVKWPEGYTESPMGRIYNMRVDILHEAGWRRRFESLDRDGFAGGVSLETTLEKSDDALHDLMRLVDEL